MNIDPIYDDGNEPGNLRISGGNEEAFELNVGINKIESIKLNKFINSNENDYIYAGRCCGYETIWSKENKDGSIGILIGKDVELWDFCVIVPKKGVSVLSDILSQYYTADA